MHSYREAKQLRIFLSKCFMDTYEFLQISHRNLLILVKSLRLCGLHFPCDSESALPRGPPGAGNLRYPRLRALVVALLLQLSSCWYSHVPVCLQMYQEAWEPWYWSLWLASSPRAALHVAVPHTPGSTCPVHSLAPVWMPSPAPFLWACQQEISWPYVYLCSMCLTTSKAMFLAVWPTLGGSQDIAMLCMDHSAMEPPLSCLKALQCTLTQVRKWWEKVWLDMAKEA